MQFTNKIRIDETTFVTKEQVKLHLIAELKTFTETERNVDLAWKVR